MATTDTFPLPRRGTKTPIQRFPGEPESQPGQGSTLRDGVAPKPG